MVYAKIPREATVSRTVLISSAGRRVGLLNCFREALQGIGRVTTIDCSATAPAACFADASWLVPRCASAEFVSGVLSLCEHEKINLLIPTIDPELPVYASAAARFQSVGTTVCVSSAETVNIGVDKVATNAWLIRNGFPAVRQSSPEEVLRSKDSWPLPVIAKPRIGSASIGVRVIDNWGELEILAASNSGLVVEQRAGGREFTINAYVSRDHRCVSAVPHWRAEVRAGEVAKGITTKDPRLVSLGRRIAEALPGAWGPLNIQCFMDASGDIRVFEINTRFGGGYPLAHRAGATFTSWLLAELDGRTLSYYDGWQDNLAMLRYDDAVYVSGAEIGLNAHA
jgi:carbamoyl-phosphate synthase large subunit